MPEHIEIRELRSLEELRGAARILQEIWGEPVLSVELLRALSTHGSEVLGAFVGDRMVGTQVAFLGRTDGDLALHSHVTGVLPGRQHAGIGFALKLAQRSWALDHGIETVTWTFDPLIARNAHFNLRKLGARAERFFRDFYGDMPDAINAGERSDRLEIVWRLLDPRAQAAARGAATPVPDESAQPLLESEEGRPVLREASGPQLLIHVPSDYTTLRKRDPRLADDWREAVAGAFERAFKGGLLAVDFRREDSSYLLDRP